MSPPNEPANPEKDNSEWLARFRKNSRSVPHVVVQKSSKINLTSRKHLNSVATHLYQLVFNEIQNIPIPTPVLQLASRNNEKISCYLSISLFDLESATFFGTTWRSPKAIPVATNVENSDSESDSKDSNFGIDSQRANLVGNRLVMQLRNQCVYFHTHRISRHTVAVLEVSFQTNGADSKPHAGGWCLIRLFNNDSQGKGDDDDNESNENEQRQAKILTGTPRVLPFIADVFSAGNASNIPPNFTANGAMVSYYLLSRPELSKVTHYWPPDSFIGTGNVVGGLKSISVKNIEIVKCDKVTISNLRLIVPPNVSDYEEKMLEAVRDQYFESFPESLTFDVDGNPSDPVILERRIYIGFHNSRNFIGTPTSITVTPLDDENMGNVLQCSGRIELENLFESNSDIALVFKLEYNVLIQTKGEEEEKGEFQKLLMKFNIISSPVTTEELTYGVEKLVNAGWAFITQEPDDGILELDLKQGFVPGPFPTFIYHAFKSTYMDTSKLNQKLIEIDEKLQSITLTGSFNAGNEKLSLPIRKEQIVEERVSIPKKKPPVLEIENDDIVPEIINSIEMQDQKVIQLHPESPRQISSTKPNRIHSARLLNAGFEVYLDEFGKKPIDNTGLEFKQATDYTLELDDERSNRVIFQFMGVTFNQEYLNRNTGVAANSLLFGLKFFDFVQIGTERVKIYFGENFPPNYQKDSEYHTVHHQRSQSTMSGVSGVGSNSMLQFPGIFYRYGNDNRPLYDCPPGATLEYTVNKNVANDTNNMRYGATSFPYYLDQKNLHIDVWDGDTLLYIGQATLNLRRCLRQGKNAVSTEENIEILWTEYKDRNAVHMRRSASVSSNISMSKYRENEFGDIPISLGTLHLKITNIGTKNKPIETDNFGVLRAEQRLLHGYHDKIKIREPMKSVAKKMIDIDAEFKNMLLRKIEERKILQKASAKEDKMNNSPKNEKSKILKHIYEMMKKDKVEMPKWKYEEDDLLGEAFGYVKSREENEKDLQMLKSFRERLRKGIIQDKLREEITTRYTLNLSYGQGYFFEYALLNPYEFDHTFEIAFKSKKLRIVLSEDEWLYHLNVANIRQRVESNMIKQLSPHVFQVLVRAKETLKIPFVIQSFEAKANENDVLLNDREVVESPNVLSEVISIEISTGNRTFSYLELLINSQKFFVDKSITLFASELEQLKKSFSYWPDKHLQIRKENGHGILTVEEQSAKSKIFVRCSDDSVVSELVNSKDSLYHLKFKYRAGHAPDSTELYFLFYDSKYCMNVVGIWRVAVHVMIRLDVNSVYGQTNNSNIILRGYPVSRQVVCYSSKPREISICTSGPFTLHANCLAEVPLMIKQIDADESRAIINVTDIETKRLLSSYIIVSHLTLPTITKVFELKLQKGRQVNKRVSYTNPFTRPNILFLRTDRPDLLEFKCETLDMKPKETVFIGLKFEPTYLNNAEIFVFLNNENDKIEECLLINVVFI